MNKLDIQMIEAVAIRLKKDYIGLICIAGHKNIFS